MRRLLICGFLMLALCAPAAAQSSGVITIGPAFDPIVGPPKCPDGYELVMRLTGSGTARYSCAREFKEPK